MTILRPQNTPDKQQKIDIVMGTALSVPEKAALLMVIKGDRLAVSINSVSPLPDLKEAGLFSRSVELTIKPLTDDIRQKLLRDGFCFPDNDIIETTFYLHFVAGDDEIAALLEKAFQEGNLKLINQMTRSTTGYIPNLQ